MFNYGLPILHAYHLADGTLFIYQSCDFVYPNSCISYGSGYHKCIKTLPLCNLFLISTSAWYIGTYLVHWSFNFILYKSTKKWIKTTIKPCIRQKTSPKRPFWTPGGAQTRYDVIWNFGPISFFHHCASSMSRWSLLRGGGVCISLVGTGLNMDKDEIIGIKIHFIYWNLLSPTRPSLQDLKKRGFIMTAPPQESSASWRFLILQPLASWRFISARVPPLLPLRCPSW